MALQDDIERLKYDKRLTDYYLKHGLITKEQLEKHMSSLPDLSSNAEKLQLFEESSDSNGHDTSADTDDQNNLN